MRRALLLVAVAAVSIVGTLGAGGTEPTYRVDAVFDSTANLIPGQDVKIAGARVGRVSDIQLTEERKARVEMEVEEGFAPFRADAECTIRPQSLIGEKFIQCRPGTAGRPPLADGEDGAPTVPLSTSSSRPCVSRTRSGSRSFSTSSAPGWRAGLKSSTRRSGARTRRSRRSTTS